MQVICFMKQQMVFIFRSFESMMALNGATARPVKREIRNATCQSA